MIPPLSEGVEAAIGQSSANLIPIPESRETDALNLTKPNEAERRFFYGLSLCVCHGVPTGTGCSGGEQYRERTGIVKEIVHPWP